MEFVLALEAFKKSFKINLVYSHMVSKCVILIHGHWEYFTLSQLEIIFHMTFKIIIIIIMNLASIKKTFTL